MRKSAILFSLGLACLGAAPALAAEPAGEVVSYRSEHKNFFHGAVRLWSFEDSLIFAGVEVGGNLSDQVALSLDYFTNVEYQPFWAHGLRGGVRLYPLPGALSPYGLARVGMLVGGNDVVGIWTLGAGLEIGLDSSGFLLDLGVAVIGAFGEDDNLVELTFGVGKRW